MSDSLIKCNSLQRGAFTNTIKDSDIYFRNKKVKDFLNIYAKVSSGNYKHYNYNPVDDKWSIELTSVNSYLIEITVETIPEHSLPFIHRDAELGRVLEK